MKIEFANNIIISTNNTHPYLTMYPGTTVSYIVGTGAVWKRGWAPCGRPSSTGDALYLNGMALVGVRPVPCIYWK